MVIAIKPLLRWPRNISLTFVNDGFEKFSCYSGVTGLNIRQLKALSFSIIQKRFIRPFINTSQLKEGRRTGLLAMKVGMLPIWDAWGERHAVTVVQVDNCRVVQVKTVETNGYTAMQLSVGEAKLKRVDPTLIKHYAKAGLLPGRKLMEFRVTPDTLLEPGTKLNALHFVPGQLVDVCGRTKGKGFAGAMKRWGFGGGFATHGNSLSHRVLGATGGRQDPGRVFKGKKMAGRMGGARRTVQNLRILKIDPNRNLLYIKGGVPGPRGSFLRVVDAVKGPFYPSPPPMPTYFASSDGAPLEELYAPVSETDKFDVKEQEEQY